MRRNYCQRKTISRDEGVDLFRHYPDPLGSNYFSDVQFESVAMLNSAYATLCSLIAGAFVAVLTIYLLALMIHDKNGIPFAFLAGATAGAFMAIAVRRAMLENNNQLETKKPTSSEEQNEHSN